MRVLIVPNTDNAQALTAAAELAGWLRSAGHDPAMLTADAEAAGMPALAASGDRPALVVTLGGDGTILRAVHALDGEDVPVLGVNLGRLGFLTGADAEEMTEAVASALAGEVNVDRLAMLDVELETTEGSLSRRALNEVFIGRGSGSRAVELAVAVNGEELLRFVCDGVIVATASGSTAYALSVGGPLIAPSVCGTLLVPVGAHTLAQRPFVLGPEDAVQITCPNPQRADACAVVDGVQACSDPFLRARVSRGTHEVRLLRPHGRHFYEVVRRKFLGG
ncbi:MAG TPA: NAD(+)/NADH kinase [Coriobacteriia bacterium]